MKTKEIYLKYKEYLCATCGIINRYEKFNRCMTIPSLDNEMNEALDKIVFTYAKVMVTDGQAAGDDIRVDDIVSSHSRGSLIKNPSSFIYKFTGFFESQADSFSYTESGNNTADLTQNYHLADIQFNVNRAQQVIDRMGNIIKGSQYIHQQAMVA